MYLQMWEAFQAVFAFLFPAMTSIFIILHGVSWFYSSFLSLLFLLNAFEEDLFGKAFEKSDAAFKYCLFTVIIFIYTPSLSSHPLPYSKQFCSFLVIVNKTMKACGISLNGKAVRITFASLPVPPKGKWWSAALGGSFMARKLPSSLTAREIALSHLKAAMSWTLAKKNNNPKLLSFLLACFLNRLHLKRRAIYTRCDGFASK